MNRYDTFWRRVGAAYIDAFVFIPLWWVGEVFHLDTTSRSVALSWSIILSFAPLLYSVWMHSRFGQTLGKMATRVVVLNVSEERRLTLGDSCLRDIGWIVLTIGDLTYEISGAPPSVENPGSFAALGALGFASVLWSMLEIITMLTNDKRRALHDWIARSVVVRKKPNQALQPTAPSGRG